MTKRTGAALARGKNNGNYQTPADFMAAVHARFGKPKIDLAASAKNAQCKSYFTKRDNALRQSWPRKLCWLNPPYGNIAPWAQKCAEASALGSRILFLVPAAVGSNWYRDHVFPWARTLLLNGRLMFVGQKDPYPKDLILAVFDRTLDGWNSEADGGPGCEIWNWRLWNARD